MPVFHFQIVDGYKIEDPVGLDCKSERASHTLDVSGTSARNVVVVDDDGTELFKTSEELDRKLAQARRPALEPTDPLARQRLAQMIVDLEFQFQNLRQVA